MLEELEIVNTSLVSTSQSAYQLSFYRRKHADLRFACTVRNDDIFVRIYIDLLGGTAAL